MSLISARFSSPRIRRLAEQAMEAKPLRPRARRALADALNASEQDREAYDRLAGFYGALEAGAPALNLGQREGILAAVQREVSAQARGRAADAPARGRGWLLRLVPALSLLLVGLVVTLALRPPGAEVDGAFQHRGSVAVGPQGRLGLKAFCVRQGRILPPPELSSAGPQISARCGLDDELQLSLTNTAGFDYLLVIGDLRDAASGNHTLTWYHPAPPTGRSGDAPSGVVDEVLGQSRVLRVNHRPGFLRVVAVFSRAPLSARAIYARLRALGPDERAGPALERLDEQGRVEVTAVELHVMIEGGAR